MQSTLKVSLENSQVLPFKETSCKMLLQGTISKAEVVQPKTKGFLLT